MCQLTLVKTNSPEITRAIVGISAITNTVDNHKDGYGIYSNGSVLRSAKEPAVSTKLNSYLSRVEDSAILHVRKATALTGKTKIIDVKNNHPFMEKVNGKGFVLAHNGTLDVKYANRTELKELRENKELIDSQIFHKAATLGLRNNPDDLVTVMRETMEKFYGKFAFLTHYNDLFYIFRGKTAQLYTTNLKFTNGIEGIIVNTEYFSLFKTTNYLNILCQVMFPGEGVEFTEIKLLPENTAFVLDEENYSIEEVGEIVENANAGIYMSPVINNNRKKNKTQTVIPLPAKSGISGLPFNSDPISAVSDLPIIDKIVHADLTVEELNYLFAVMYCKSIFSATQEEFEDFKDSLDVLISQGAYNKRIAAFWDILYKKTATTNKLITREYIMKHPKLEPLYFLNTPKELEAILND